MACCFNSCKNTKIKNSDVVFFEFPRDKKDFKIWVERSNNKYIKNLNYKDLSRRVVCEKHFFSDSIIEKTLSSGKIRRCLKKHSLPKISLVNSQLSNHPVEKFTHTEKEKMPELNFEDNSGRPSSPSRLLEFIDGINFKLSDFSPASPSRLPAATTQSRRPPKQRRSSKLQVFPKTLQDSRINHYSGRRQKSFKKSEQNGVLLQPKELVIHSPPAVYPQRKSELKISKFQDVSTRGDISERVLSCATPSHSDKINTASCDSGNEVNSIVPLLTPKVEISDPSSDPPIQRLENQSSQVTTTNDQICSETICPHYIALYEEKAFSHLLRRQNEDLLRRIAILEMKLGDSDSGGIKVEKIIDGEYNVNEGM